MNKKIVIIQDEDDELSWHWFILRYENEWYTYTCGKSDSYELACKLAKEEYDKV